MSHRTPLFVLCLFLLLAILFTYPLTLHLATHAPTGEAWTYDGFSMLWNMWWFQHALLVLNTNPFFTNAIFFPIGTPLYLHSDTLFSNVLVLPLLPFVGVVTASNLVLLASIALCGFGAYLLALWLIAPFAIRHSRLAAFIAGVVFAFSSNRFVFLAQGHYNFVTTEWLPFYVLYLLKSLRAPTRKHVTLAAIFLALTFYVELSLGVVLLLVSALVWLITLSRPVSLALRRALTTTTVVALATLIASPYVVPALRESLDPKYIPQYWGGAPVLSSDVLGMFTPSSLSTLFGSHDWPREWLQVLQGQSRFVDLNTFVIGFGVGALALLGAWRGGRRAHVWLWLALILIVLAWGPILHVNGMSTFDFDR
ncbi:MAG: hypothetical protein LC737_10875, partial [Chloroflexi bacterium]|nr:hypothetical protein [Chloroflexota bacterium]